MATVSSRLRVSPPSSAATSAVIRVVSRRVAALLHDPGQAGEERLDRRRRGIDLLGLHQTEHRTQGVGPLGEHCNVRCRHAEEGAHDLHGQPGKGPHQISVHLLQAIGGHRRRPGPEALDRSWRERLADEPAQPVAARGHHW
jgi:hypothetical protein